MIFKNLGIVVATISLITMMSSVAAAPNTVAILDNYKEEETATQTSLVDEEVLTKTSTELQIATTVSDNKTESQTVDCVKVEEEPKVETKKEPEKWWTQEEEDLLTQLVWHECGSDSIPDEAQQLLVAVVLNQMNHPNFSGDTIKEVIYRPGNFSCASYLGTGTPTQRCRDNVVKVLSGEVVYPNDIVWMSSVPQCAWNTTVKIYKVFDTSPYKMYFCHYGNPK